MSEMGFKFTPPMKMEETLPNQTLFFVRGLSLVCVLYILYIRLFIYNISVIINHFCCTFNNFKIWHHTIITEKIFYI